MVKNILKIGMATVLLAVSLNAATCNSMSGEKRKIKRALMSLDLTKNQQDSLYKAENILDSDLENIERRAKNNKNDQLYTFFNPNRFDKNAFEKSLDNKQYQSKKAIFKYIDSLYMILTPSQLKEFRSKL